jgi:predicted nucleotidyltransferase
MIPELTERRAELDELCRRFGVRQLEVFGSAVAGDFNGESDLEFLVEFADKGPGYADRYFGLLAALEDLFRRPVDLVVPSAIRNPFFKKSVERTKTLLYAA